MALNCLLILSTCRRNKASTQDKKSRKNRSVGKDLTMERKFLEDLGLEKEKIDKIMTENGNDIEKAKGDKETVDKELTTTKELLKEANKQIESFKEMDIETIKKSAEDYKQKYEQVEQEKAKEIADLKKEKAIDLALINAKAKNIKSVKANLDLENIKLDGDKLLGFDDQVQALQKSDAYLFDIEEKIDVGNDGENGNTKETIPPEENKESKEDQMLKAMGLK